MKMVDTPKILILILTLVLMFGFTGLQAQDLNLNAGILNPGDSLVIYISGKIKSPFPSAATQVCNQALVQGDNFSDVLTDDPDVGGSANPTCTPVVAKSDLIITEIMYDPNSPEDPWEWVEVYNSGSSAIDLTGYVLDDNNGTAHGSANIASGSIPAGQSAVLFNAQDLTFSNFLDAWGTVDLIAVTNWSALSLNNTGDKVSLWESFSDYTGDNTTHANAVVTVDYGAAGFPDPVGASIFLTDLSADPSVGTNWGTSTVGGVTPLFTGYPSIINGTTNTGTDIGSPGIEPDVTPPLISSFNPPDDAINIELFIDLLVTFNEDVQLGSGNIVLRKDADDSVVETFDVSTSSQLSIAGPVLTIDPTNLLEDATTYYVTIDNGAIEDLAGNPYQGFSGKTVWNFTTIVITDVLITVDSTPLNGWDQVVETGSGSVSFISGPGTPPLNNGSAEFNLVDATSGVVLGTQAFTATPLASIVELQYSTYNTVGNNTVAPALQINIDYDLTDGTTSWQGRLIFEPYYDNTIVDGTWQTWSPLNGRWWSSGTPVVGDAAQAVLYPISSPGSWSDILTAYPNAGVQTGALSGVLFKAGSAWPAGYQGSVDEFIIRVGTTRTTVDFEPACDLVADAGQDVTTCAGDSVTLGGSPTASTSYPPVTYSWIPSIGLSNAAVANPKAAPATTTAYILNVTDDKGCTDSDTVVVTVNPSPVADAGTDKEICSGLTVKIGGSPTASGGTAPYTYSWAPTTGLNNANIANPMASPATNKTYIITVTDAKGCSDKDTVEVIVNPSPVADAGPDETICLGDLVELGGEPPASGGTEPYTYLWTPSTGLDDATFGMPIASPAVTTVYILTVTDDKGCADMDTVMVTVNPLPIVTFNPVEPVCEAETSVDLSGYISPSSGTFSGTAMTGSIFNPFAAGAGSHEITYTYTNQNNCTSEAKRTIVVNPLNHAPEINLPLPLTTNEDEEVTFDVNITDSDAGSGNLKLNIFVNNGRLSLSSTSGLNFTQGDGTSDASMVLTGNLSNINTALNNMKYKPNSNYSGDDNLTIQVDDQGNTGCDGAKTDEEILPILVKSVNDGPVAMNDNACTVEDSSVTIDVLANDFDQEGRPLSVYNINDPDNGAALLNSDGTITYIPAANFYGMDNFKYSIKDDVGGNDHGFVYVFVKPVNDLPVAENDQGATKEDSAFVIAVLNNDIDVDGDTLTVTSVTTPQNGTATINGENTVTYTPNPNFSGNDAFIYKVSDGHGGFSLAFDGVDDHVEAILNVQPANITTVTLECWVMPCLPGEKRQTILSNTDGALITIETKDSNGDVFFGVDTGAGLWTPVQVTANEWQHIAVVSSTSGVTFYKNGMPYMFSGTPDVSFGAPTFTMGQTTGGGNNFAGCLDDVRGWAVARSQSEIQANMKVKLSGTEIGLVAYYPVDEGTGLTAFDQTIFNNHATLKNGSVWLQSPAPVVNHDFAVLASVSITVEDMGNNAPIATPDTVSTDEDETVIISVLANDSDPEGTVLSLTGVGDATNGTVNANQNGTVTYTPNADFNGSDNFTYNIKDAEGGTAQGNVLVNIAPVNDAPVAVNDTTVSDTSAAFSISVLDNDSDVEGDELSVSIKTQGINGVATVDNQNIVYTPDTGFNGQDSFIYTVTDDFGGSATATVFVEIDEGLSAPSIISLPDVAFAEDGQQVLNMDEFVRDDDHGATEIRWGVRLIGGRSNSADQNISKVTKGIQAEMDDSQVKRSNAFKSGFLTASSINGTEDVGSISILTDSINVSVDNQTRTISIKGVANYYTRKPIPVVVIASDPSGLTDRDTIEFSIESVNDIPSAFDRILPADGTSYGHGAVVLSWEQSSDVDGDALSYSLNLIINGLLDTTFVLSDTLKFIDFNSLVSLTQSSRVFWSVKVSDGQIERQANNGLGYFDLSIVTGVDETQNIVPDAYALHGNYPNPFNPTTTLSYDLPEKADVRMEIYNVLGKKLRTLIDGVQPAGQYTLVWDAKDEYGVQVTSGIYFLRMIAKGEGKPVVLTHKMMLMK